MASHVRALERVPLEVRNEIYSLVLLTPVTPTFEGKAKSSTYHSYLSIMRVNKKVYEEVKALLTVLKPLVVISCNISQLGPLMTAHSVPYISDHSIIKVQCYSMRVHVKFPTFPTCATVTKSFVILETDLTMFCLMIRCFSLTLPFCPGESVTDEVSAYPQMYIHAKFHSKDGCVVPRSRQVALISQMKWLNNTGRIRVSNGEDGVAEMLPGIGRKDILEPPTGNEADPTSAAGDDADPIKVCMRRLRRAQTINFNDAIKVGKWINSNAHKAVAAKDYGVALDRYKNAVTFIRDSSRRNEPMADLELVRDYDAERAMDVVFFRAEIGMVQAYMKLQIWEAAAHRIQTTVATLENRSWLTASQVAKAARLAKYIEDKMGEKAYKDAGQCGCRSTLRRAQATGHQHGGH